MTTPKQDEVRSWLNKARQDLEAAEWLLKSPMPLYGTVGFHCQQSAEKTLKAYLTWHEQRFEKTHSLVTLVGLCRQFNPDFDTLRRSASSLTPFAVDMRYPGDLPELTEQEATETLQAAQQIWDFVYNLLPQVL